MIINVLHKIDTIVDKARRDVLHSRMTGESPWNAKEIEQKLREAADEVDNIISHRCEFGDNDYCGTCGMDGRA